MVVKGGIVEQTEQVLENVKAALALAGCTLDDVVKTTVLLEDARDFGAFNGVYGRYFANEPPARTTAEARMMIDIKIEVEADRLQAALGAPPVPLPHRPVSPVAAALLPIRKNAQWLSILSSRTAG